MARSLFVGLSFVSSRRVLIGSSSPVSRSSSSSNYTSFSPSVLAGLAFLGSATEHSSHTPLLPLFSRRKSVGHTRFLS